MVPLDVRASLALDAPSVCMETGEHLSGVHDANLPPTEGRYASYSLPVKLGIEETTSRYASHTVRR
jgi:hypothetical protein